MPTEVTTSDSVATRQYHCVGAHNPHNSNESLASARQWKEEKQFALSTQVV